MSSQEEKKTITIFDEKVFNDFDKHTQQRGLIKYRAVEAALTAFMALPPDAQMALMSNTVNPEEILKKTFSDLALQQDLAKLSPARRTQILELARQAAKTICGKK